MELLERLPNIADELPKRNQQDRDGNDGEA
jgi:hypothetical protein